MVPIIYTTYAIAMRHGPETLAECGGLRPAGAARMRVRTAPGASVRARSWLAAMLVRVAKMPRWLVLGPWNAPARPSTLR
jgi:hypothetical protein